MTSASASAATILVVDDHAMFREALRMLLETDPTLRVVGEAGDGRDAIRLASELRPDLILLDLRMPGTSGLQALREIARITPPIRTLLLTAEVGESDVVEALRLGAKGVVMKESHPEVLFESIHTVLAGQYWVGRDCVADLIRTVRERRSHADVEPRDPALGLTARERQVVAAIVVGCSNADIAQKFSISAKTVKHHLTKVFDKLGVSNRLELALFAVRRRFDAERFYDS
ncbi:MAG: DNA-binding response regulator [Acidobacteria bacterium]|nr:MAG: DNA-binding response regulator [Acidobacteriota bacterium]